ncbi:hypothetical protein [Streptomyces tropicalis]|uniref:Integral membrane protein n=1 Tax=Streptomyces tropicalis TaxID=3034234 RepID=A0ABT6A5X4_9ACTN|nr:hypothetical protein [Streptomyces tropicalis]MDF3300047.1 hypothetical protein [Streptomyces tropicalis]
MKSRDSDWLGGFAEPFAAVVLAIWAVAALIQFLMQNRAPLLAWGVSLVPVCLLFRVLRVALPRVREQNCHRSSGNWPVLDVRRDRDLWAATVAGRAVLLVWPLLTGTRSARE